MSGENKEIEVVPVYGGGYMSHADADAKGYKVKPDAPVKGAPILAPGWLGNLFVIVVTIAFAVYFKQWWWATFY